MWIPAWAWVLSVTWQDDGEFEREVMKTKDDARQQVVILGEYLLTHNPHEDTRLACVRWLEQATALARG